MQVEIRCFYTMEGIGKESKKPFKFHKVKVPLKASSFQAGTTIREAHGLEDQEVEISEESAPQFAALKLPGVYDVETEMISSGGKMVMIFTGVRQAQKQA